MAHSARHGAGTRWCATAFILVTGLALAAAGCGTPSPAPATPVSDSTPAPTTIRPTPTSTEPLAARVNGDPITLAEFEQEIARYEAAQASQGIDPATQGDYRSRVLTVLVEQLLVEQAARAAGHTVAEAEIEAEIQIVIQSLGSPEAFANYLAANGYTDEQFRRSLGSQLLASKITSEISGAVPETAEQAHARHILVDTEAEAQDLRNQLLSGADFATLAVNQSRDPSSRIAGGDLGWFPRNWLTVPEVEQAAFDLPLNAYSDVVRSALGYHIVQALERGPRPLPPEMLQAMRMRAVQEWVEALKAGAAMEIYVTP